MYPTSTGLASWLRERPLVPDTLLAALLTLAALPIALGIDIAPAAGFPPPTPLSVALVVLGCAVTALRRLRPFTALCVSEAAFGLLSVLKYNQSLAGFAVLIMIYTVAAHRGLAISLLALVLDQLVYLTVIVTTGGSGTVLVNVFTSLVTLTVWMVGRSVRLRRAYLAELRDRAERLERAREADTRAARAEERSRIARELHDVVAHHVSVMTVQAAAARRILTSNPEGAKEALAAIEEMGRTAMAEMRNIVGVLRTDDHAAPAERGPQPGMHDLPALVEQMREAGLTTQLWVEGEPEPLPPGIDLAAYRLVQEGLTNTLRHAGPSARAWVTVRYEPGEFSVCVEDDGPGPGNGTKTGKTGHGLVGIRERVALYGGILRIGPRPGGGFEVRARFPLKDGR